MDENERLLIVSAIKSLIKCLLSIDQDKTVKHLKIFNNKLGDDL